MEKRGLAKRVNLAAVYRRIDNGLVRFESVRLGRPTVTSAKAIQRWAVASEHLV